MGLEYGKDGRLVKWSNLFNYTNADTLAASMRLPMPRKGFQVHYNATGALDISKYIDAYLKAPTEAAKLTVLGELITDIFDYADFNNLNEVNVACTLGATVALPIITDIYTHNKTPLDVNQESSAYKNHISASISNIILDAKNLNMGYSPVTLEELGDLADKSTKGALTAKMSLMNPLTKLAMLALNMIGKDVIGIGAVGEKVFFNLNWYYNEGIKSKDEKWIKNMLFAKTFSRIEGRATNNLSTVTKTLLSDIYFGEDEELRLRFLHIDQIDQLLRKDFGITNADVKNKTPLWEAYKRRLEEIVSDESGKYEEELLGIHRKVSVNRNVDLMISLVLSAATDNAKELILDKINCGKDLAKCYLHLLMLGFDISDITVFMTSPAVELIATLSLVNILDSYILKLSIQDTINLAKGIIDPKVFIIGSKEFYDYETGNSGEKVYADEVYGRIKSSQSGKDFLKKLAELEIKPSNFSEFILLYILSRVAGEELLPLEEWTKITNNELARGFGRLSDFVEKLVYLIKLAKEGYGDRTEDYDKDLAEFTNVYTAAEETSRLGSVFLGLNQGLPTDKVELQKKLSSIERMVSSREKIFGIRGAWLFTKAPTKKSNPFLDLINKLAAENSFLNKAEIEATLRDALALGVVGNFNVEYWLNDKVLTEEDIRKDVKEKGIAGQPYLLSRKISYKQLVSDYYNIIKATWNVFDVVERVPHYKELVGLLKTVYNLDKESSIKSKLFNTLHKKVLEVNRYVDENLQKSILSYINDLLVSSYFTNETSYAGKSIAFPIFKDMTYFNSMYSTMTSTTDRKISLNTPYGRASFKAAFEAMIAEILTNGKYGDIDMSALKRNKFIQDLQIAYDSNGRPKLIPSLDMTRIGNTPHSTIVFQQYLDGFDELKLEKYNINGISLADWFMLYNLFVNLNLYGSDRLTTILRQSINDSILENYFAYVGNKDWELISDDLLESIGFSLEDLLLRLAPYVPNFLIYQANLPYIRTTDPATGKLIYLKRISKGYYKTVGLLRKDSYVTTQDRLSNELAQNYDLHQMIKLRNYDFGATLRQGLSAKDVNEVGEALGRYMLLGIIKVFKDC